MLVAINNNYDVIAREQALNFTNDKQEQDRT
jgi:hypothetical protein